MAYLLLIQGVVYVIGFYKQVPIIHEKTGLLDFFLVVRLCTAYFIIGVCTCFLFIRHDTLRFFSLAFLIIDFRGAGSITIACCNSL